MNNFVPDPNALEAFRRCVVNTVADEMDALNFEGKIEVSEMSEDKSFIVRLGGRGIVLRIAEDANGNVLDADVVRYKKQYGIDGVAWAEVEEYEPHRPKNVENYPLEVILHSDAVWMMFGNSALA